MSFIVELGKNLWEYVLKPLLMVILVNLLLAIIVAPILLAEKYPNFILYYLLGIFTIFLVSGVIFSIVKTYKNYKI